MEGTTLAIVRAVVGDYADAVTAMLVARHEGTADDFHRAARRASAARKRWAELDPLAPRWVTRREWLSV